MARVFNENDCKVYVGNLGNCGDDEELYYAFSQIGEVCDVFVPRNRGYAFVEYYDPRDAIDAVRFLDNQLICNRWVRVEKYKEKNIPDPNAYVVCTFCGHFGHQNCNPNRRTGRRRRARARNPAQPSQVAPQRISSGPVFYCHGPITVSNQSAASGSRSSSAGCSNVNNAAPTRKPNNASSSSALSQQQAHKPTAQPKKNIIYKNLSGFKSPEDFMKLSVAKLKELLTANSVDYTGFLKKAEFIEHAIDLWIHFNLQKDHGKQEAKASSSKVDNSDNDLCKICMDAPLDCVLLECGHVVTCYKCSDRLAECPICRKLVTRVVKTYRS